MEWIGFSLPECTIEQASKCFALAGSATMRVSQCARPPFLTLTCTLDPAVILSWPATSQGRDKAATAIGRSNLATRKAPSSTKRSHSWLCIPTRTEFKHTHTARPARDTGVRVLLKNQLQCELA